MKTNQSNKIQKLLLSTVIGITALVFTNCKKETEIAPVQTVTAASVDFDNEVMAVALTTIPLGDHDLTTTLPSGYVTDGSVDYTSYVQAALNKYTNITFPAFPILVNDTGLFIRSNATITFLTGSEIRLKGSSKTTYNILRMSEVSNVMLINPIVIGDSKTHIGITGEGGVGIGIRGSSNVTLINPNVRECWGDGIYIGQARNIINSTNVTIKNAYLKRNRRAGISIISVDGLVLDKIYAGYSQGVLPMCGINFEPNNPECTMKNIKVNNITTIKNGGQGIQLGLRMMLGKGDRYVDFSISNIKDTGSRRGFKAVCNPTTGITAGQMYGVINVSKASWNACTTQYLSYVTNQPNFKLALSTISMTDTAGVTLSQAAMLMELNRSVGGAGSYTLLP